MNKRQASFIMQLPDGYEWEFMMNGKYLAGYRDTHILIYEIIDEKLIQREIYMEQNQNGNRRRDHDHSPENTRSA